MRKVLFVSIALLALVALTAAPVFAAASVTKTLIRQDRYNSVYRVAVTWDNAYRFNGESITIGKPIDYAVVESNGRAAASDSLAYFVVIEDSTFSSGTLQLRLYRAAAAPGAFVEVPQGRDVSAVAGVRLLVWTKR